MSLGSVKRLQELATSDPAVAPLALLQAEALVASADPSWERGLPTFGTARLSQGVPLLHGETIAADPERATAVVVRLLDLLLQMGNSAAGPVLQAVRGLDTSPLELVYCGLTQDAERIEGLANRIGTEPGFLGTLAQVAALPLLQSCGRRAKGLVESSNWRASYCPVCGAWPTLAEMRGLERQRWLRCGRCASGWRYPHHTCVFCGNGDHRTRGYLAPESERETKQAVFCDQCRGYLKTLATLGPLGPEDILVQDITTLELDLAALDREYLRPAGPGFRLETRLEPTRRRNGMVGPR